MSTMKQRTLIALALTFASACAAAHEGHDHKRCGDPHASRPRELRN